MNVASNPTFIRKHNHSNYLTPYAKPAGKQKDEICFNYNTHGLSKDWAIFPQSRETSVGDIIAAIT